MHIYFIQLLKKPGVGLGNLALPVNDVGKQSLEPQPISKLMELLAQVMKSTPDLQSGTITEYKRPTG